MIAGSLAMAAAILLAFLRVPLAFALLAASVVGIGLALNWTIALQLPPLTISDAALSCDLAVVPMFILMGNVISKTGIAQDLFRAAYAFVGGVRGRLAQSTMAACAGFSAVCGSSYATAATMAKVAHPSMNRYGYSDELAAGTIAAGGTLGVLIPPSIIMVIYGILTQTNIGDLFVAGVVPGLMGLGMYMLAIRTVASRDPAHAPRGAPTPWPEELQAPAGVWPFLLLFGLIVGGLYGKLFTPTEAAGMGAGLAILIATLHGRRDLAMLRRIVIDTAYTSVSLYAVLFGALMLSKLLTRSGLASGVLALVQSTGLEGVQLILAIMLAFHVFGCVMDSMAIILIFAPVVAAQGFDLVWFGIIVIVVTEIALVTPPVGINVYVLNAAPPQAPIARIFRGLVPFIAADVLRLGALVAAPAITLWLGGAMR